MRFTTTLALAAAALTGCMTLHADVPDEVVRHHIAREEGIEIAAVCPHAGQRYSEGALACMADQRMRCDTNGRWIQAGACGGQP